MSIESYDHPYKSELSKFKLYLRSNFQNVRSYIQSRHGVAKISQRHKDIADLLDKGSTISFGVSGLHMKDLINQLYVVGFRDYDTKIDPRVIHYLDPSLDVLKKMQCQNAIALTGYWLKYKTPEQIAKDVEWMSTFVEPGGQIIFEVHPIYVLFDHFRTTRREMMQDIAKQVTTLTGHNTQVIFPTMIDSTKPLIFQTRVSLPQ